jgi:hypothetical protein
MSGMNDIGVFSLVGQVLAERNWKPSDLIDRLDKRGYTFDRKTVYRLTQPLPIERISGRLVRALCEVFQLTVEDLISLEPPRLRKIDAKSDKRLSELMEKNSRGELSEKEREDFQELGAAAERISLENARLLAAYRKLNVKVDLDKLRREKIEVPVESGERDNSGREKFAGEIALDPNGEGQALSS